MTGRFQEVLRTYNTNERGQRELKTLFDVKAAFRRLQRKPGVSTINLEAEIRTELDRSRRNQFVERTETSSGFKRFAGRLMLMSLTLRELAAQIPADVSHGQTSIFAPAGTPAHSIFGLSMLVFGITGSIFLVVVGLLSYVLFRYRHRPSDTNAAQEPTQIYGSNQIELSWTVIPILLIFMLFLGTARVIYSTQEAPKPATALEVTVIGHQFWWEYRYPKFGVVAANELHVPVSDPKHPTPTYLTLSSADTDHSFWIPRLAGKTDLIPNKVNTMWIDPQKAGLYVGQCAQYCGTQHAKMLLRVYADTPAEFAAWVAHQQQPATNDTAAAEGEAVFQHTACITCHTVAGTVATGTFGPDLTHLASRATIASGAVPNTRANIRAFVDNPAHFKPGARMPAMHLSSHDLDEVASYLTTLQ